MCGCSGGSTIGGFSSSCGKKVGRLSEARDKLARVFNIEKDPEIKARLKEDRLTIDTILKESALSNTCPDLATVVLIETEVNNEYSKYNNT